MRDRLLQYVVMSEENKILAVKEYRAKSQMDLAEFFDRIYEQDYFLKEDYQQVEFINSSLEFSLIPTQYFKPQSVKEFAGALIKESDDADHLEYHNMDAAGATAIYTVPFSLKQKCDFYFAEPEYLPFCRLAINMAMEMAPRYPQAIVAHIFEGQFVLTVVKEGRLHLCNAYDFGGVTDIVYFVQLVTEITKLDAAKTKILLSGEFEQESELLRQLRKYLPGVMVPQSDFYDRFDTQSDKLPHWKYAYLSY